MVLERFRVDGKVAIVTGAGRGIGAATAVALAEAGADVLLAARTVEQLEAVAAQVRSHGRRALVVLTDDDIRNAMIAGTPLKRLGEADDIAIAALYLASPAAAFVTGKLFEIDGGLEEPNLQLGLPDL